MISESDVRANQLTDSLLLFLFHRRKRTAQRGAGSLRSSREAARVRKENGSQRRAGEEYDPRAAGECTFYWKIK